MDFVTFFEMVERYLVNSDNALLLLYAVATCLLTQLFKKLFVNKVNVDVLHKFDYSTLLPFLFGLAFAVVDVFCAQGNCPNVVATIGEVAVNAVAIGAFATVAFKFVSSLSGQSLSSLMKNDVFGAIYSQLLYFGNARQKLLDKTLSWEEFISQVKQISANAEAVYRSDDTVEDKRSQLAALLGSIIDDDSIAKCLDTLSNALITYTATANG